jgi:hypothetical protein
MIDFLSGALCCAYVVASLHFLRFWRRTGDVLFRYFGIAFLLFALNQAVSSIAVMAVQSAGYEYLLRVAGFLLILVAITQKNFSKAWR